MKKIILSIIIVSMLLFSSNALAIVRYHPERDDAQEFEIDELQKDVSLFRVRIGGLEAKNRKLKIEVQELRGELEEINTIVMTFQKQILNILNIVLSFAKAFFEK